MKCSRCGNAEAVTVGTVAFTKPVEAFAGVVPEDVSGTFCDPCQKTLWGQYAIGYRPEMCSRAEARRP